MKNASEKPVTTPDEYVARQPVEYRPMLEKMRSVILSVMPKGEELISYQVICYKYFYMTVGIGTTKGYCSLYCMSSTFLKTIKDELKEIKYSGSTIHFPLDKPLPVTLIKKITKARMKENEERAAKKK